MNGDFSKKVFVLSTICIPSVFQKSPPYFAKQRLVVSQQLIGNDAF